MLEHNESDEAKSGCQIKRHEEHRTQEELDDLLDWTKLINRMRDYLQMINRD